MADLFLGLDDFATTAKDEIDAGGVQELIGDGGGHGGVRLVGKEGGDTRGGDGSGGDDADGPAATLGLIEKGVGRFAVVAEAELVGGTDFTGGEEGGQGGGVTDELVGGVGFHKGHGVGLIESGEIAVGMAGLREGEEFRAGPGNEKDDDGVGTGADEVPDVAVGESNKREEDDQGNQLRAPTFHNGILKQNRLRGRCG